MNNQKLILLGSLLLSSTAVMSQTSLLEEAGKQMAKDAAKSAAPEAVRSLESANETVENAKALKGAVESAPETAIDETQEAAKDAAQEKLKEAVPGEATQAVDTIKSGKKAIDTPPKSTEEATEAVKNKATQKATEKAFDLLR